MAGPGSGGGYIFGPVRKVVAVASPTALAIGSDQITKTDSLVEYDVTNAPAGAFTVNLPGAAASNGAIITVKRLDGSGSTLTVVDPSAATIDGQASLTMPTQYSTLELQSDGVQWLVRSASEGASSSSGGTPGGPAGGDLSGTYPNPTVVSAAGAFTAHGNITIVKTAPALLLNGTGGTADQIAFQNNGSNSVGWNLVYALTPNWFGLQNLTTGNYSLKADGATDNVTFQAGITAANATLTSTATNGNTLTISDTPNTFYGASIKLIGDGATTPSKTIAAVFGSLRIYANDGTTIISGLDDSGNLSLTGGVTTLGDIKVTGNVNVQGNVSSTSNTSPASTTNSGVSLTAAPNIADIDFFDSTQSVNNRTASWLFFQGAMRARFYNDAHSAAVEPLVMTGGQAGGITGIASDSGSGSWAHTGPLSATGNISTPANVIASQGAITAPAGVGSYSSAQLFTGSASNQPSMALVDNARSANNRTSYLQFAGGDMAFAFANDAFNAGVPWLVGSGGQAGGITGITSNSGSGSWVHTGPFSASGAINSSVGLTVKEGANAKQGTATLAAGTVVVSNTSVTANSRIFLTSQSDGGTPGFLRVSARTAGTSFTITSSSNIDTSVVAYEIFEPGS